MLFEILLILQSLLAIGGQAASKANFVFPRLFENVLEFSNGPTRIQGYSGWSTDSSFVQLRRLFDFCSVKVGNDVFVFGGNSSVRFSFGIESDPFVSDQKMFL